MSFMKKNTYIKIAAEIEKIENQLELLDENNAIERTQISQLHLRLDYLLFQIQAEEARPPKRQFQLITNEN